MADITLSTECPVCGDEELELEIVVDSPGSRGSYGLPEYSEPGEGAEWHIEGDVECERCGAKLTGDELTELQENADLNERVQRNLMERDDYD